MYSSLLKRFSSRKLLLSLIMVLLTQAVYSVTINCYKEFPLPSHIAPVLMAGLVHMPMLLAMLFQLVYSKRFEWVIYTPVWILVSVVTKIPISDKGCLINPNAYANSDLPIAAMYVLYVLIELIIWSVLMFFAGLIIHAIRKGVLSRKLRSPCPALDDNENSTKRKSRPLWHRLAFSSIDALLMACPVLLWAWEALFSIDEYIFKDLLGIEHKGFQGTGNLGLIILICCFLIIVYTGLRILFTLLMHQRYKSYLASLPFYILSGVAVYLTAPSDFSGWQYSAPLVWKISRLSFSLYSSTSSYKLFFAVSYILQWFIVISLVFAVKAFIKYCNRQFIKESLERKKNS